MSKSALEKVLEESRPAIEKAVADAERELGELDERRKELLALIDRGRAALGEAAQPRSQGPLTLHEAVRLILEENGGDWMPVSDVTAEVNRRNLYRKRDGSSIEANQVHARTKNYSKLFEKDRNRVRLRKGGD